MSLFQLATEGVKSKGKGKQSANTVSRQNSVTHNSRHLKAVAKVCSKIGRRDLQANALARYSKVHAALLNINKPCAAREVLASLPEFSACALISLRRPSAFTRSTML